MHRKWDIPDDALLRQCLSEVIARIDEIDGAAGVIAAQDIVDIVTEKLAPIYYAQGVVDAKKLLTDRFTTLEIDLDQLGDAH